MHTAVNSSNYFTDVDYGVFGFMLLISLAIGVYFGYFDKKEQTTEEYLLGGRKMKTIPIAISLIASQLSALSIMTIPAEVFSFGSNVSMVVLIQVPVVILINFVFIPIFYNNNIDNCYAYLEMRFSKAVRTVVTLSFLLYSVLMLPIGSFIPSLAFASITGHNIHVINTVTSAVCVFYTMLGGIKAVVWTDVIQAGVMLLSILAIAFISINKVGGLSEVLDRAIEGKRIHMFDTTFDLTTRQTIWNCGFGMFVLWGGYVGLNQSCVQRIVALPSITHARRSLYLFCLGVMLIMGLNCFTGVITYAYFYDCDPVKAGIVSKYDKIVPYFVQEVVGQIKGMPGLFISCVFSASLSTISANLNSLAGVLYSDYIRPRNWFKHSDATANLTMKLIVLIVGTYCVLAGFIVEQVSSIFQVVNTIIGMTCGAVFGVFCLGMLYPRANSKGALWSTIVSMLLLCWIITGSQILASNKQFQYTPIDSRVDGCESRNITILSRNQSALIGFAEQNRTSHTVVGSDEPGRTEDSFSIYRISFQWFPFIGALTVWLLGIPISHIFGSQKDLDNLNPNLIAPQAKFLIPQRLLHIELQQSPIPDNDENSNQKEKKQTNELNAENEWMWTHVKDSEK